MMDCPNHETSPSSIPLGHHHWLTFQHLLLAVGGGIALVTLLLTLRLAITHLKHYAVPEEQRQIVRLIWTPFVFAVVSLISIARYQVYPYVLPLEDLYEAFGFTALFLLFVQFVAPDPVTRGQFFQNHELRKTWSEKVVPGGAYKWFNRRWVGIFQFLFIAAIFLVVEEVSTARGHNCGTNMSPKHSHFWIVIIPRISTIFAVTAVLRFYRQFSKTDMKGRGAAMKLLSFKLIVFFNVVQGLIFNILDGHLKGSAKVNHADLTIGLPAILIIVEAFVMIALMQFAYRASEYASSPAQMGFFRASADFFNPDIFKGFAYAIRLIFTSELFRNAPTNPPEYKMDERDSRDNVRVNKPDC